MEIAYLAGLFDGEGCIRIAKVNNGETFGYSLQIAVQLLYQKTILEIYQCFGGSVSSSLMKKKGQKSYTWYCCGFKAAEILELMFPYLREKKEQARLALDYAETIGCGGRGRASRTETEKELQELYCLMIRQLKVKNKLYNELEVKEEMQEIDDDFE